MTQSKLRSKDAKKQKSKEAKKRLLTGMAPAPAVQKHRNEEAMIQRSKDAKKQRIKVRKDEVNKRRGKKQRSKEPHTMMDKFGMLGNVLAGSAVIQASRTFAAQAKQNK